MSLNNISCISMFIKMALKKYDMIDYHDGCGRGDKACARKLAQGTLRKHFLHIHFGRVSHVICHTTLFAHCPSSALFWVPDVTKKSLRKLLVTLGAGCHQKLAQAAPHANLSLSMMIS